MTLSLIAKRRKAIPRTAFCTGKKNRTLSRKAEKEKSEPAVKKFNTKIKGLVSTRPLPWSIWDSNPRPFTCEANALPAAPMPPYLAQYSTIIQILQSCFCTIFISIHNKSSRIEKQMPCFQHSAPPFFPYCCTNSLIRPSI